MNTSAVRSELRASSNWAIALLGILGAITLFVSDDVSDAYRRNQVLVFGILLCALAFISWALDRWKSWVGRWFIIVVSTAMVGLAHIWLGVPGVLALAAIPTGLAAALISLPGAVVVAAGETMLLLLLNYVTSWGGLDATLIPLMMVWITLGLMYIVYSSVYQHTEWAWDYSRHAQTTMEEARNRRAEIEQALDDLMNANRQLALASERMAALRKIAQEARRAKTTFVASVSHEFRTPLNMIIGMVGLMMETPEIYSVALSPKMRKDFEVVYRNCQHLSAMIGDVLDLTQTETGNLTLHREQVDLRAIIHSSVAAVHPLMENKQLSLTVVVPDDLPEVNCDRTRIKQVILNLLSNAIRFTEEGGITVEVIQQGQNILVSVMDTGPGLAPEDVESVFEPFWQGRGPLWRHKGGTGLGLSISERFVRVHGGRMWLESELGVGACFFFTLPISPPVELAARPGHQIREGWVWRERMFRAGRVVSTDQLVKPRVIICDETGELCDGLRRHSDQVEFVSTRDVTQTGRSLQECPAHAVLLNTKGGTGVWSLMETVRRESPDTPILACSMPCSTERVTEAGALGYLTKPVACADLRKAIKKVDRPVKWILVVDDDPDVLRLLTRMLHVCDSACEVVTVSSGREALDELRGRPFDLVLLDILMPDMDGWQVLKRIYQDERTSRVPTFFLSAQDPADQPPKSPFLLATIGEGLSLGKLLDCSLGISSLLMKP